MGWHMDLLEFHCFLPQLPSVDLGLSLTHDCYYKCILDLKTVAEYWTSGGTCVICNGNFFYNYVESF